MDWYPKILSFIPYIIATNVVLSAVASAFHGLAVAGGKSDSGFVKAIGAISGVIKKIVDYASANQAH